MAKVQLGNKVRDKISGFTGTVVAVTEWIAGCKRITVCANKLKDGKPIANQCFDEPMLEVIKPKTSKKRKKPTGGDQAMTPRTGF